MELGGAGEVMVREVAEKEVKKFSNKRDSKVPNISKKIGAAKVGQLNAGTSGSTAGVRCVLKVGGLEKVKGSGSGDSTTAPSFSSYEEKMEEGVEGDGKIEGGGRGEAGDCPDNGYEMEGESANMPNHNYSGISGEKINFVMPSHDERHSHHSAAACKSLKYKLEKDDKPTFRKSEKDGGDAEDIKPQQQAPKNLVDGIKEASNSANVCTDGAQHLKADAHAASTVASKEDMMVHSVVGQLALTIDHPQVTTVNQTGRNPSLGKRLTGRSDSCLCAKSNVELETLPHYVSMGMLGDLGKCDMGKDDENENDENDARINNGKAHKQNGDKTDKHTVPDNTKEDRRSQSKNQPLDGSYSDRRQSSKPKSESKDGDGDRSCSKQARRSSKRSGSVQRKGEGSQKTHSKPGRNVQRFPPWVFIPENSTAQGIASHQTGQPAATPRYQSPFIMSAYPQLAFLNHMRPPTHHPSPRHHTHQTHHHRTHHLPHSHHPPHRHSHFTPFLPAPPTYPMPSMMGGAFFLPIPMRKRAVSRKEGSEHDKSDTRTDLEDTSLVTTGREQVSETPPMERHASMLGTKAVPAEPAIPARSYSDVVQPVHIDVLGEKPAIESVDGTSVSTLAHLIKIHGEGEIEEYNIDIGHAPAMKDAAPTIPSSVEESTDISAKDYKTTDRMQDVITADDRPLEEVIGSESTTESVISEAPVLIVDSNGSMVRQDTKRSYPEMSEDDIVPHRDKREHNKARPAQPPVSSLPSDTNINMECNKIEDVVLKVGKLEKSSVIKQEESTDIQQNKSWPSKPSAHPEYDGKVLGGRGKITQVPSNTGYAGINHELIWGAINCGTQAPDCRKYRGIQHPLTYGRTSCTRKSHGAQNTKDKYVAARITNNVEVQIDTDENVTDTEAQKETGATCNKESLLTRERVQEIKVVQPPSQRTSKHKKNVTTSKVNSSQCTNDTSQQRHCDSCIMPHADQIYLQFIGDPTIMSISVSEKDIAKTRPGKEKSTSNRHSKQKTAKAELNRPSENTKQKKSSKQMSRPHGKEKVGEGKSLTDRKIKREGSKIKGPGAQETSRRSPQAKDSPNLDENLPTPEPALIGSQPQSRHPYEPYVYHLPENIQDEGMEEEEVIQRKKKTINKQKRKKNAPNPNNESGQGSRHTREKVNDASGAKNRIPSGVSVGEVGHMRYYEWELGRHRNKQDELSAKEGAVSSLAQYMEPDFENPSPDYMISQSEGTDIEVTGYDRQE